MQIDRQLQDLCWLIIGGLLTVRLLIMVRYIPKHINKGETEMTENEYHETFDMRMEREHQDTLARMREFQIIGEQISKMPVTSTRTLEIEVRYLMGIISELEAQVKNLESETRRLEQLVHRVTN
jgi:hypothetical protein